MTLLDIIESLILGPLTILFECIYSLTNVLVRNPGLSIVALSLMMNILVLPLYKRADEMQEEARQVEVKLQRGVTQIKKFYTGDERMMILQTYYNQNHYKPIHALKGSVSLLLQIPFFMAAYNFLSTLADLQGTSFGPIANLGAPDGLLAIGGVSINLLPILMTLINVISGAIYLKGFPTKTKVQTYGLALLFLVLLYNSPAGLVFYWTLNNVFSLCKSTYYKLNIPKTVLRIGISAVGAAIMVWGALSDFGSLKRRVIVIGFGLLFQAVWLLPVRKRQSKKQPFVVQPNKKLFLVPALFLTVLIGVLIPSTYIAASPQEYVDINYFFHPLWFVLSSLCLAAGTFLIWARVFYWLAKPRAKVIFERALWILSGVTIINYMFFGRSLGIVSASLQYQSSIVFENGETILNVLVIALAAAVLFFVVAKWNRAAVSVLLVATVALGIMSAKNVFDIKKSIDEVSVNSSAITPEFELSQDGQNVVVIMLDRAMGRYVPYIFNEKPEFQEKFDGFTYYSNTISYGTSTNFGVPPLMGGYEYTPVEMNKNDSKSLKEKHNEALKVMPVLFAQNQYDVTVCDPSYANYQWIPDLSIYDEYPDIDAYLTRGRFNTEEHQKYIVNANMRNFFCFSMMKCMPVAVQSIIYHGGKYHRSIRTDVVDYSNQTVKGLSKASGNGTEFLSEYNAMRNLGTMTKVTGEQKNTFLFLQNKIAHSPSVLQTPDYIPADTVDNAEYDAAHADRFVLEDGSSLKITTPEQMRSYHCNMAAFVQLANWFDQLREAGVYDNTRIILVSDHGDDVFQSEEFVFHHSAFTKGADCYFPLLMVKDFGSEGFTVSAEFMTNADVPTLAADGLIQNPINPFTGKEINSDEKTAHDQYLIVSDDWDVNINNGNTFMPGRWISVSDDLWDKDDWEFYAEEIVLKEHAFPE